MIENAARFLYFFKMILGWTETFQNDIHSLRLLQVEIQLGLLRYSNSLQLRGDFSKPRWRGGRRERGMENGLPPTL